MQIILSFDDELLAKYNDRNSPLLFGIVWKYDCIAYPNAEWLDFGAVIMAWWLVAALKIVRGSDTDTFSFMDGPYSIRIKYDRNSCIAELIPQGLNVNWHIPFTDLLDELSLAANRISRELIRTGTGEKERMSLEKGVIDLRTALKDFPVKSRH